MSKPHEIPQAIIERDVYCPFCEDNGAFLICDMTENSTLLQMPEVGCVNAGLMLVTGGCWALVKGYPLIEKKRTYYFRTYGFCPHCGNVYYAQHEEEKSLDEKGMSLIKDKFLNK